MLKRVFWLSIAVAIGWLLYRLWQQLQDDFGATSPQLAPLEPYDRHISPPAPAASPVPAAASIPAPVASAPPPSPPEQMVAGAEAAATQSAEADVAEDRDSEAIIGYCARCKTRRPISGAHRETTDTGRRAARGMCPVCGAKMFTFLTNKAN
jgi:hypothetical protein